MPPGPNCTTHSNRKLAVSNFLAKKSATHHPRSTGNLSWPQPGVQLDLYRSSDKINFTVVNTQTSTEDTAGNFTYSENIPPPGSTYYYVVRASKAGSTSITSDTSSVTSTPTITALGSLGGFLQGIGTPSGVQAYTVSAANLTTSLTITPPAGFEVSADGGTTWYNSGSPLVLPQTGGNVSTTTISVRLNSFTAGPYSGNIAHTATGAGYGQPGGIGHCSDRGATGIGARYSMAAGCEQCR